MRLAFGEFVSTKGLASSGGEEERPLGPLQALERCSADADVVTAKIRDHWPATFVSGSTWPQWWPKCDRRSTTTRRGPLPSDRAQGGLPSAATRGLGPPPRRPGRGPQPPTPARRPRISLHDGENLLGRVDEGRVWIESPTVSRRHARILVEGGRAILEDLASKNGTFLRGERIASPAPLADGDEIRLGKVTMTLRIMAAGGSTQTADGP
jgi:hypothetical protein